MSAHWSWCAGTARKWDQTGELAIPLANFAPPVPFANFGPAGPVRQLSSGVDAQKIPAFTPRLKPVQKR
ncbi:hypothetical protein [Mobiluncus holmesii]|uniref:hypothetical protein n=1 Tax=Mobiluncus holmesii TaxID=144178 RepID=UPI0021CC1C5A|nr:hypothetical protein [Mobiluncus holmesii]